MITKESPLSPGLESKVLGILDVKSPLDSPDFNPSLYINQLFPNEQSMASIDLILDNIQTKSNTLEQEIERLTKTRGTQLKSGAKDIDDIKAAIQQLVHKIEDIRTKATHSEVMVQDITQDVKSLDHGKRNLTHTLTILKRLQMLITAVDQLEAVSSNKQYKESAQLLEAVTQLMQHFKTYKSVPQISYLSDRTSQLQQRLEQNVLREFDYGFDTRGKLTEHAFMLPGVCLLASALGAKVREKIIVRYVDLQLADYRRFFQSTEEVSQLENIDRRYAYLARTLKACEDEHGGIFPVDWHIGARIYVKFCHYTRTDLSQVLAISQPDVKELLTALRLTIKFESEYRRRFEKMALVDVESIASSFHPYLWVYVEAKDRSLTGMIDTYQSALATLDDDESMQVLPSSTDLFKFYGQSLEQCTTLSTGSAFFDLSQVLAKHLVSYCDHILLESLNRVEKERTVSTAHFRQVSLILNTTDYCLQTTSELEGRLKRSIDPEFKEKIDLQTVKDVFMSATSKSVDALVQLMNKCVDVALQHMTQLSWGILDVVGDQSGYINELQEVNKQYMPVIGKTLTNRRYLRTFCDRFVDSFLQRYLSCIFRCKPISEVGAQQMLLDTHALKTLLLILPTAGETDEAAAHVSASYTKLVNRGISRAEAILKASMSPTDPPEGFVENYVFLIADKHQGNFLRLLDLKGLKKSEFGSLLDTFQKRVSRDGRLVNDARIFPRNEPTTSPLSQSPSLPSVISTSLSTMASSTTSPGSLSPPSSSGRLNENFRKLVLSGMSFRKDHDKKDQQT